MALRAVKPGEAPPAAPKKMTVTEAAESGDHRALLVAMRERIARSVQDPGCPPRDLAALTRRLQDVAKEIEGLDLAARQEAERASETPDEAFDSSAI